MSLLEKFKSDKEKFTADRVAITANIAEIAEKTARGFDATLVDVIQKQQKEIDRLSEIIEDALTIPARVAVQTACGMSFDSLGHQKVALLATCNDGSMWVLSHVEDKWGFGSWKRIPGIPQLSDDLKALEHRDEMAAIRGPKVAGNQ